MPDENCKTRVFKRRQKQCRLCGISTSYALNMFNFFVKLPDCEKINNALAFRSIPLAQLINECLNIDVKESTNLPLNSCKKCCNQLVSWYRFRYCCIKQQSRFKEKAFITDVQEINESVLPDENKDHINRETERFCEIDSSIRNFTESKNCLNQHSENVSRNRFFDDVKEKNPSKSNSKKLSKEKFKCCNEVSDHIFTRLTKINENKNKKESCENKFNRCKKLKNNRHNKNVSANSYSPKKKAVIDNSSANISGTEKASAGINIDYSLSPVRKKIQKRKNDKKNIDDTIFQCDKCSKTFCSKFSIRKHLKTHSEELKYCCHVCGLLFKSQSSLRSHDILHSGIKKFSCPHCSKKFSYSNHLKQHIRIHTGEKPYQCKECEQKFARSCQLTQHVWSVHRKEKIYNCDICGKGFFVKFNFKAHMMRHNGQKNAKCDFCQKAFVTKNALFRHKRQHTGEKPFVCEECGERFADCSNRKKHMVNHHSGMNSTKDAVKSKAYSIGEDGMITKPNKLISTNFSVKNKTATVVKSLFETPVVLLDPPLNTDTIVDSKLEDNFIKGSNLKYENGKVYLNLNNIPIIDLSAVKDYKNDMQLTVVQSKNSESDEELAKTPSLYVSSGAVDLDSIDDFGVSDVVEEIPFSDDFRSFNSLNVLQKVAYFIPDKEILNPTDMLTQNTILENVTFNKIDIDSSYINVGNNQQKVNSLSTIVPCEAQSIIKINSNEGTVILYSEPDNFSQISEV